MIIKYPCKMRGKIVSKIVAAKCIFLAYETS